MFTATGSDGGGVYCLLGREMLLYQYIVPTSSHPSTIHHGVVCFSFHGVGELAVLLQGVRMNMDTYLELLCDYLPSSFEKCAADFFMHDEALRCAAIDVKQKLCDCQG